MKLNARWLMALAVISVAFYGTLNSRAATSHEKAQAEAAAARAKDPKWKPSCEEVRVIRVGDSKTPGSLKNFCLNAEGNILALFSPRENSKSGPKNSTPAIRVYSPKGELLETLPLTIKPGAIAVAKDGSIFVAG